MSVCACLSVYVHVRVCVHACARVCVCVRLCAFVGMGWLRLVGSIKLQVSFAQYRLFNSALLQKRPIILSILLREATPYAGACI